MRQSLIVIWVFLCLAVSVCVAISFFLGGVMPVAEYFSLFPQAVYFVSYILLIFSGYFIFGKKISLFFILPIAGLVASFIWVSDVSILHFSSSKADFKSDHLISVVNWNTKAWDTTREEEFFTEMKKNKSDVYLLQEVSKSRNSGLNAKLRINFPEYSIAHDGEFLTLSRFPIIYNRFSPSRGYSRHDIYLNNHLISFYNVHIRVPIYGDRVERNNLYDFKLRRDQFEDLGRDIYTNSNSLLLAGDFNSMRNYSPIRLLERQLKLNQPSGILVFPKTFSTVLPAIRIDYQFTSLKNSFTTYKTFGGTISDHFGIYGEFYDNY